MTCFKCRTACARYQWSSRDVSASTKDPRIRKEWMHSPFTSKSSMWRAYIFILIHLCPIRLEVKGEYPELAEWHWRHFCHSDPHTCARPDFQLWLPPKQFSAADWMLKTRWTCTHNFALWPFRLWKAGPGLRLMVSYRFWCVCTIVHCLIVYDTVTCVREQITDDGDRSQLRASF